MLLADLSEETERAVAWVDDPCVNPFEETLPPDIRWVRWEPGTRSLLYGQEYYSGFEDNELFAIHLDQDGKTVRLLDGAIGYLPRFSPSGNSLSWESTEDATDPESFCFGSGENDIVGYRSLMNLTVDLRPRVSTGGGAFHIDGTAVDLDLARWWIDYTDTSVSGEWHPVAPPSSLRVIDDLLTSWIPPRPGVFQLRLTVEDKAGNVSRASSIVSYNAEPAVTDVYVEPQVFSPNGDSVLEEAVVHYRALGPVHARVEVRSSDGLLVRTLAADHVGPEVAELRWDGRNDSGTRLPDGRYKLTFQESEFFVTVDTNAPTIDRWRLERELSCDPMRGESLAQRVAHSINDASLILSPLEALVERATVAAPNVWNGFQGFLVRAPEEGPSIQEVGLSVDEYTGARFRVRVTDVAGNTALATTEFATEELLLREYGVVDPQTGLPLDYLACAGPILLDTPSTLGFRFTETVAPPIHELFVQYQPLPVVAGEWIEEPLADLFPPDPGHTFQATWDMTNAPPGENLAIRWRGLDAGGGDTYSRIVEVGAPAALLAGWLTPEVLETMEADEQASYLQLLEAAGLDESTRGVIWGKALVDSPSISFSVVVVSPTDSRYQPAGSAPVVAQEGQRFLAWVEDARACTQYDVFVEAQHEGGVLSKAFDYRVPCLDLAFKIDPVAASACDLEPANPSRPLVLTPESLDGEPLHLLTITGPNAQGDPVVLFSANGPTSEVPITWHLDLEQIPEGVYPLVARLTNIHGEETVKHERFFGSPVTTYVGRDYSRTADRTLCR